MGYNNVVADMQKRFSSTAKNAGVLELADEADSKSVGLITRAGSTPATGTKAPKAVVFGALLFTSSLFTLHLIRLWGFGSKK